MTRIIQLVLVTFVCSCVAHAQPHVHGQGTLFVIQEGEYWQFQYILPAADALGFEHAPDTSEQKSILLQLKQSLENYKNLMSFNAQCSQDSVAHNLEDFEGSSHKRKHEEHEHDEHKHEDHANHQDVEVAYVLKCGSSISTIAFSIFNKMHSLETIDVQWSVDNGQGSKALSKSNIKMELK